MAFDRRIRTSLIGIVTDITLIAIKSILAMLTGSLALLADALHSSSDLVVSGVVFVGILLRKRQEKKALSNNRENAEAEISENDDEPKPPPGYWIESIIAYAVSLVILYVPYAIITRVGTQNIGEMQYSWLAIGGVALCIAIAYFISTLKILVGRDTDSPALVADGYHSRMDMFTTIAVLFSILGQLIGIKLDSIVAVIIAVMIGITGLELFFSSIFSFWKKSNIRLIAIWQWIFEKINAGIGNSTESLFGRRFEMPSLGLGRYFSFDLWFNKRNATIVVAIFITSYFLSGVTVIQPDQHGIKMRFGKIIDKSLDPGIHYNWPWPIEHILKVSDQRVYRVEVGFKTTAASTGSTSSLLWETRHVVAGYTKVGEESIMLTGDENLIDFSIIVHYQPTDTVKYLFEVNRINDVLHGLTESIMREVMATRELSAVLTDGRQETLNMVRDRIEKEVDTLDLGVRILSVKCHDIHPPLDVVPAFRDVFSAKEDQMKMLNEAETYRNEALPKANAEVAKNLSEANAYLAEKKFHSAGEAEKFKLLAEAYKLQPDITNYRLFLETAEAGLAGKRKIIANPEVNRGGYRLWLFSPNRTPFPLDDKSGKSKGSR